MTPIDIDALAAWIVQRGLSGASEQDMLHGFCAQCRDMGIPLSRALVLIDTLHPVYEGRAFRWRDDGVEEEAVLSYGRTDEGEAATTWQQSFFYSMLASGAAATRHRLAGEAPIGYTQLETLKADGHTDLLAQIHRFADEGVIGQMDCVYSYFCTRMSEGFADHHLGALKKLGPTLALALKCTSLARIAGTLVEVYLGRDAGRRVLSGRILRGVADRINAALWFSDLRGYTRLTEAAAPDEIIPLLNDYAEAAITSIQDAGGDVLKLIGDGVLAIFTADEPGQACACALEAETAFRERLEALRAKRHQAGQPVTTAYLGLHIGTVFYGNIGSDDRLDFTVVGPAVNEVSRIASMCRSADREVLLSADFVAALPEARRTALVSIGRYALRGVARPRELFTIDREA